MFMKMKQPKQVRALFAERKKWLTIDEIASGLSMHRNTVSKIVNGKSINPDTARTVAGALDEDVMNIAEFVN